MKKINKGLVFLLIYLFTFNNLFAGSIKNKGISNFPVTMSGIYYDAGVISSDLISSKKIDGIQIESFEIRPISKGATYLNGKIYTGIELSSINIGVVTLTGKEDINDFFLEPIIENEEYEIDWFKVVSQFSVGTTVIFITGILHFSASQSAPVFFAATGDMLVGSLTGAISGAATDALMAGMLAAFEGQPKEGLFKSTIESAASGYMWGAIVGAITGGISGSTKITSTVNDDLVRYLSKGTIQLRDSQIDELLENPRLLRDVIKAYTGQSSIKSGYMEFFVRLSKGSPSQAKVLLENESIFKTIASTIRSPGGKHEWLMVKNYLRYLVDPPGNWSAEDGLRAAVAIDKLVQATSGESGVVLRSGVSHKDGITAWHNGLSDVIDESRNFNDAINKIYQYGRNTLNAKSYLKLKEIIMAL